MYAERRAELRIINQDAKNGLLGYFEVEFYGLRGKMKKNWARPHYGLFQKTDNRTILYSATVWTDETGEIFHSYEDEFIDDLSALKCGNVDHQD